ncbi:MAG: transposase family protein [Gammaproteobacteria bacterium]|nr:transposase family protein [Gammaproteobacteria bacterium]
MSTEIWLRVQICVVCLQKEKTKAGVHVPATNGFPGQMLYVDLVHMLPSPGGYNWVIEDGFSWYILLAPLKTKTAMEVVDALLDKYVSRFGCPLAIHSDNGKEFNKLFATLLTRTTSNPQSNNLECFHRTLGANFRMLTEQANVYWKCQLPALRLAYNLKVNETTGLTPFLAFLGREAKIPVDMVLRNHQEEYKDG